jgi:hypothetical protein
MNTRSEKFTVFGPLIRERSAPRLAVSAWSGDRPVEDAPYADHERHVHPPPVDAEPEPATDDLQMQRALIRRSSERGPVSRGRMGVRAVEIAKK